MKNILKGLGLGLLAVVVLIVLVGLFTPAVQKVEEKLVMNVPIENAFAQVNVTKNWQRWSPWYKLDPTQKLGFSGPESGNGATYTWDSQNDEVGAGTMTLSDVKPNEFLKANLKFRDWGDGINTFAFKPTDAGTEVTMAMEFDNGWNIIGRLFTRFVMLGDLSKKFKQALVDIEDAARQMPVAAGGTEFKIQQVELQPGFYLTARAKADEKTLSAKLGELYGKLGSAAGALNVKPNGAVGAIYYTEPPMMEFDAVMPISSKPAGTPPAGISVLDFKGGTAVKADYYGDYMKAVVAHQAIDKWMTANGFVANGAPWEVYVTDPMAEKDTAKWLTEVIYPIKKK